MSGACLIETTTAGIDNNALHTPAAATRANIKGEGTNIFAASDHFATIGYRGATAASVATISSAPWFHDADTKADGVLVNAVPWRWAQPYGKFFGIYPRPADYSKLTLSPESYTSTPYVDFEVDPDVTKQTDFMTAYSGTLQYSTRFVAPTTNLQFTHALTAVRFKVGANLSYSHNITKVEIINAMSKARYTLPTTAGAAGTWGAPTAPATFTLSGVNVSTSAAVNQVIMGQNNDNYTFYMIPQSLAGVSVKIYFDNNSTPAITANLAGTWKPGTTKTYALSQNTSDWSYVLTSTSPAAVAYDQTASGNYTIQSYREDPVTHVQQPVKWEVVGYDADGNGTFSMAEKPAWLTSLSKTEGDGGTSADQGTATLKKADLIDLLKQRNDGLKNATALGSAGAPYDLSLHDHNGNTTLRNTANSYLISAPGHYRIPLVYGNAIENGVTYDKSYISHAPTGNSNVLYNFQDHAGHNIDNPWIEKTNSGANASVDGAEVVWADAANLVHSPTIVHDGGDAFLDFEVKASDIQSGNAVVAVKKSGTIVWSWHLWFAPKDALDKIPVTNHQGKVYNFTKETLGWKPTQWAGSTYTSARTVKVKVVQTVKNGGVAEETIINITQKPGGVKKGVTTLYQFGRKDAFPGVAKADLATNSHFTENAGDNMSIKNNIQNPDKFYVFGSSLWTNYDYNNFWSADNTVTGGYNIGNDNPVVKTVYDPCPAGFKIPANNAFTGFTTTGLNSTSQSEMNVDGTDNGQQWTNNFGHNFWTSSSKTATINFPASGLRSGSDGSLNYVGYNGYYTSAVPSDVYNGCLQILSLSSVSPLNIGNRTVGFAARPVSE